jgi:hypothetical protein
MQLSSNEKGAIKKLRRFFLVRSATLRAGLRRKERSFSLTYPALIPQRAARLTALHFVAIAASSLPPKWREGVH